MQKQTKHVILLLGYALVAIAQAMWAKHYNIPLIPQVTLIAAMYYMYLRTDKLIDKE
jgi:hypothetical protein